MHRTCQNFFFFPEGLRVENIEPPQWSLQFNLRRKVSQIINGNKINIDLDHIHRCVRMVRINEIISEVVEQCQSGVFSLNN